VNYLDIMYKVALLNCLHAHPTPGLRVVWYPGSPPLLGIDYVSRFDNHRTTTVGTVSIALCMCTDKSTAGTAERSGAV